MALGDGVDNAAFASLLGEFTRRPMADGTPRRLWGLTGQSDDLAPLFRAEGGRSPRAWGVLWARISVWSAWHSVSDSGTAGGLGPGIVGSSTLQTVWSQRVES